MKITDTIAAISTSTGNSGIGIIRVSGDEAIEIVDKIFKSNKEGKRLINVKSHTVNYKRRSRESDQRDVGDCHLATFFHSCECVSIVERFLCNKKFWRNFLLHKKTKTIYGDFTLP